MSESAQEIADFEAELDDLLVSCYANPLRYVETMFTWNEGVLLLERGPKPWQRQFLIDLGKLITDRAFDGINPVKPIKMAVSSGVGPGKAQPVDTIIDTPKGPRTYAELRAGDWVFGVDGRPVRVLAVHERGRLPVYRIAFDDGSSTRACADHLWTVRRGDGAHVNISKAWQTLSVRELLDRGLTYLNGGTQARQWMLPQHGSAQYPFRGVSIDPYTLGVWLGDGTRRTGEITSHDEEVRARIVDAGYVCGRYHLNKTSGHTHFTVRGLREHLRTYGLCALYSHQRYVPDAFKFNAVDVRRELLRGLFDSDGCVDKDGTLSFTSTSKRLADDVAWLARSLGAKVRYRVVKQGKYRDKDGALKRVRDAHTVNVRTPNGERWVTVPRKAERLRDTTQERYLSRWIDRIDPDGDAECRCLTVDREDGLYLTNDFIVTHNTALLAWIFHFILDTRPDAKCRVTANTNTQLDTATWAEIRKWGAWKLTAPRWAINTETTYHIGDRSNWFGIKTTCAPENAQAFAGWHNRRSSTVNFYDEGGTIPEEIFEKGRGIEVDGEPFQFVFGQCSRRSGQLHRAVFGSERDQWNHRIINGEDHTTSPVTLALYAEWADTYGGTDSDYYRVHVKGLPPNADELQYIDSLRVQAAQRRPVDVLADEPLIAGVDVSGGGGAWTVCRFRRGNDARTFPAIRLTGEQSRDRAVVVSKLAEALTMVHPGNVKVAAMFVDSAYGAVIVERLRQMGHTNVFEVNFGGPSPDPKHDANYRAFMWRKSKDWCLTGALGPKDTRMETDATAPGYHINIKNQLVLESKADMQKRGVASPDDWDAHALTFAQHVAPVVKLAPTAPYRPPNPWS